MQPGPGDGTDSHLRAPWAASADEVLELLGTSAEDGLSEHEAQLRLERHGPNQLREARRRSAWRMLRDQFTSPIVALLVVAAGAAFAFDESVEGFAIVAVIFINALIGFATERRAVRSMESLRQLGHAEATVRRAGRVQALPAAELVPGDLVIFDAGDVLTADLRIVSASRLQADESPLTGESMPVDKQAQAVDASAHLADRTPMLFKGTAIARGSGEGVVTATGMATELGRISSLVEAAEPETTPLEKRLNQLARRLIRLTLLVTVLVATSIAASGRDAFVAVEMAIALAVATIPEGLPIVATVALARGMWRMARRNALVEQLAAVETLGSTTVLLTDKTGTLTENRMTLVELRLADRVVRIEGTGLGLQGRFLTGEVELDPERAPDLLQALQVGVLCNNATLDTGAGGAVHTTGDPTEIALLVAGAKAGLARSELLRESPELSELAFDPTTKRMATLHEGSGVTLAAVKGAPETLLECCTALRTVEGRHELEESDRADWLACADEMAASGKRVLALASRELGPGTDFSFEDLTLLGLVGFFDPPRERVRAAVDACQDAGIRVIMVTGDHGATAWSVAAAVGLIDPDPDDPATFLDGRSLPTSGELSQEQARELLEAAVIARATPQQKLDLIERHQRNGAVVAMTGDGVNDAPALKKADIGIAMGLRGTQVAREAADMVLQDDEIGTIVTAIAQGRAILANIRKFVIYLLSCNVSEILVVGLGSLAQGPLPILPLQILFLNLVTDVFPALALGVCEGSPGLMRRPPRDPAAPLLTRANWRRMLTLGGVMALSVLGSLGLALSWLEKPPQEATTIAFLTLALAQLWHVFAMRSASSHWLRNEVTRNPWIWGALGLCLVLLLAAVYWPPLALVLGVANPGPAGWALATAVSLIPFFVGQVERLVRRGDA